MEPVPSPPWTGASTMMPPAAPTRLPKNILLGFSLAGLGVVFTLASRSWEYFGLQSSLGISFYTFIQIEILLNLVEFFLLQLGLFFIFLGTLRLLPNVRPWSRIGPIFILVGALVVAGFDVFEAAITTPPGVGTLPEWVSYAFLVTLLAGSVLTTLGLIASLFAVVKGVLLRSPPTPGVPQP